MSARASQCTQPQTAVAQHSPILPGPITARSHLYTRHLAATSQADKGAHLEPRSRAQLGRNWVTRTGRLPGVKGPYMITPHHTAAEPLSCLSPGPQCQVPLTVAGSQREAEDRGAGRHWGRRAAWPKTDVDPDPQSSSLEPPHNPESD